MRTMDFQDVGHDGHLELLIETIFLFLIYVTLMLPIKFKANWSFGSE